MDHLLHQGRGAGGNSGAESDELQMACLMGLVSYLAGLPEVQRISPFHESRLLNAVAGAIAQSGNIVDRPLNDAGLDGTGEVIQVSSCFESVSCTYLFLGDEASYGVLQLRVSVQRSRRCKRHIFAGPQPAAVGIYGVKVR